MVPGLKRVVSYLIMLIVLVLVIYFIITQTASGKGIFDLFINNNIEELESVDQGFGSGQSLILRDEISKIITSWEAEATGLCRLSKKLPVFSKSEGYNFYVEERSGKLYYVYEDRVQGLSFEEEAVNLKRIYFLRDIDTVFKLNSVNDVLSKVKSSSSVAFLSADEKFWGKDYDIIEKKGSKMLIFQEKVLKPKVDSYYEANEKFLWNTVFRLDDALIIVDGNNGGIGGTKESDKESEINNIQICGG